MKEKSQRYIAADFWKGVAMIGVLMVHYQQRWDGPSDTLSYIFCLGSRGVQMFFLLTGFLTWASVNRIRVSGLNGGGYKGFYRKRFMKIAPLYYLSLLLAAFIPATQHHDFLGV